jgi:predicted heme/steroid binding protein
MATIASLVIAFVARTEGVEDATKRLSKQMTQFQGQMDSKLTSIAARFLIIERAVSAVADGWRQAQSEGQDLQAVIDSMQAHLSEFLTSIPVAGTLAKVFIGIRDEISGEAGVLRSLTQQAQEAEAAVARFAAQAKRAEEIRNVWKSLEHQISTFGDAAEIAGLKALRANEAQIAKARELLNELGRLRRQQEAIAVLTEIADQISTRGNPLGEVALRLAKLQQEEDFIIRGIRLRREQLAIERQMQVATDVKSLAESLQHQIDTFGMAAEAAEIYAQAKRGAKVADVEMLLGLVQQLDGLRDQQEMMDRAMEVVKATRTPMEQYQERLAELHQLLDRGLLDWDTYTRAVNMAEEALRGAANASRLVQNPSAVEQRFTLGTPGNESSFEPFAEVTNETRIANKKADERKAIQTAQLKVQQTIADRLDFGIADF